MTQTGVLDAGAYTFAWIDALAMKVRQGGRIVNTGCARGHRGKRCEVIARMLGVNIGSG